MTVYVNFNTHEVFFGEYPIEKILESEDFIQYFEDVFEDYLPDEYSDCALADFKNLPEEVQEEVESEILDDYIASELDKFDED